MSSKKGWTMLAAILLMVSVVFAACSPKNEAPSGATSSAGAAPLELPVFAALYGEGRDLETNAYSNKLEALLNIDFKWETAPVAESVQKKQLMFASGDYPAVILMDTHSNEGITKSEQMRLGGDGILLPLNDLIDQYAPNIKQAMDETPGFRPGITTPDGNIYSLPYMDVCFHCYYQQKMWINSYWLDALGLEAPTTTEEFYQVLKAFKEQDPNGNGIADEIPLAGSTDGWNTNVEGFLMNAFIYNNSGDYLFVENGKVDLAANKPAWREGLRYLNKLYEEGLIDPQSFTQNNDALKQKTMPADRTIALVGAVPDGYFGDFLDGQDPRYKMYDALAPLIGPEGVQLAGYFFGIGDGLFAITNKATDEQRIAAIKVADYAFSGTGFMEKWYGPEGVAWKKPEGQKDTLGRPAKYEQLDSSQVPLNVSWNTLGPTYSSEDFYLSWGVPDDLYTEAGTEPRLYKETKEKYEGREPREYTTSMYFAEEDIEDYTLLLTQIKSYIKENIVQFIIGDKNVDSDWDRYVAGFDKLNLAKYVGIVQKTYDSAK